MSDLSGTGKKTTPAGERRRARERSILEAAERVFGRSGYWNATTAEIASEVGITQPALYRYFSSKRELFMAALALRQDDLEAAVAGALREPGSSSERIDRIGRATSSILDAHPEMAMLRVQAIAVSPQDEQIRLGVQATMSRLFSSHEAMIRQAIAEGTLDKDVDPHTVAATISGLALMHYITITVGHPLATDSRRHGIVARLLSMLSPKAEA